MADVINCRFSVGKNILIQSVRKAKSDGAVVKYLSLFELASAWCICFAGFVRSMREKRQDRE